jgi:hypothetical protein
MHTITGKCEIIRICGTVVHTKAMTLQFSKSLNESKTLVRAKPIIRALEDFSVEEECSHILHTKKISTKDNLLAIANIRASLDGIRCVNLIYQSLLSKRNTAFCASRSDHMELLDEFWNHMFPGKRRNGGLKSEDWKEIGFQGIDPSSDFRGLGMLGLFQLCHLATHFSQDARKILAQSVNPRGYFPFAVFGINLSSFILELFYELRLHKSLLIELDTSEIDGKNCDLNFLVNKGEEKVHDIFAELFNDFAVIWKQSDPENIFAFPAIFADFKRISREKYIHL